MQAVILVVVSLTITSAVLSSIFFLAWRTLGRQQHALTWAIAFAFATLHWIGNLSANLFPNWQAYWISVNVFGLLTLSFALLGHCQRAGVSVKPALFWAPPAVCLLVIAWFTIAAPHAGLRVGLLPIYGAIVLALGGSLVLNCRDRALPAEWGAAIAMFVLATAQAVAGVVALLQGATVDETYSALYSKINFLIMPGAYTATGLFIIFVLASDLAEQMKQLAMRDQLTGLLNRHGFVEASERAFSRARRAKEPLSVIVTDIDHFKKINDRHGHETGDQALEHFARILDGSRRREDVVARVGGEEFALLLPGVAVEDAIKIADNLCKQLAVSEMRMNDAKLKMSASFGVAVASQNDISIADILNRADAALYRSKRAGRNRIDLEASQIRLMPDGALTTA